MLLHMTIAIALAGLAVAQSTLPGAAPLTAQGDLALQMVDAINADLLRKTSAASAHRSEYWKRDYRSRADYERSVAPNRERFRKAIGAVDPRVSVDALEYISSSTTQALVAEGAGYKIFAVRWPVFHGVTGAGLLLQPNSAPLARVVALPDGDDSPEMLAGIAKGIRPEAQFARRLAENGCQVLIPALIDRRDTWSGNPEIRMTNQPHREFIYRMAFQVGRHVIGYEVQKTLAAVDWFEHENRGRRVPIAVAGYGEGGLIALSSAASDTRIDGALVAGYFSTRQELWKEPIYRDVWGLLREFGDAEIAGLIAPRALIVETGGGPEITSPPPETKDRKGATPNGALAPPPLSSVKAEIARAQPFFAGLSEAKQLRLVEKGGGVAGLLESFGGVAKTKPSGPAPVDARGTFDPAPRSKAQFEELIAFTQELVRQSPRKREQFWANADSSNPERWKESTRSHRDYIWREVIGRLPDPSLPPNPRARLIYDTPAFRGYEVMLDVWPTIYAYGILLVPKDIRPGERRPVVVCQHGLEGRPADAADPAQDNKFYHAFAARLAEQGFITFSPQNPYIGEDRFRIIQRKAHPLKLSLFSYVLGQHQQALEWLASLPFVDPARIGFYGLSYGGKTAVRVPPLLEGYALSICSADFNEWVWKTTSVDSPYSYMFTREYDMLEFDFGNVVNYSDLANLMAPRPFMVERGHLDGVAPDEWVAYEFSKVRRFYDTKMNMPDRARIEFFTGPHTIHGKGTFEFLRQHLQWPR
jgi:dienelactone hydrolase